MEGHVRRGEFVQAIREAERLLMVPDLSPREMGRLFRLAGRARGESGETYASLKYFELAIPWALRAKDWDCLGMARAESGIAWLTAGDLAGALDALHAYLLDHHRYDKAKVYLGHVQYNLGLTYRRRRDYESAVRHYVAAVEWFTEKGYTLQAAETHQNLAWLYCLTGNIEEAERELELAESFSDVCRPDFKVEQLVCRALVLKSQGLIGDAMKMVEEVLQPGRPGASDSHRGYAAWITGTIALALRQFDKAIFFADLAINYAMQVRDTGVMSQAAALRSAALTQRGDQEQAAG